MNSSRRGILRPFARDGRGGFAKGSGEPLVAGRVGALVSSTGELPWKPELDSGADRLRNVNNSAMLGQFATVYAQEILQRHEPAITLQNVVATRSGNEITIRIDGHLASIPVQATGTVR